jgi:diaminopimelate decarboxylase
MEVKAHRFPSNHILRGVFLRQIVSEVGTPLYIYDADTIRSNYQTFYNAFSKRYKRFQVLFSLKANFIPSVVRVLLDEGAGIDCSSRFELDMADALGVPREKVLFNACFPCEDMLSRLARENTAISFNDLSDFDCFATHAEARTFDAPLSFRLSIPSLQNQHNISLTGPRFGIPPDGIMEGYLKASRLGFQRFGIHAMSGSNVLDPDHFALVAKNLASTADLICQRTGHRLEFIDIGGGFGIPYAEGEGSLNIDSVADQVVSSIRGALRGWHGLLPALYTEPGRYLVGNAGFLLAKVCSVKHGQPTYVGIDASTNIFMRRVLYQASHQIAAFSREGVPLDRDLETVSICGQLCDNLDILASDVLLPHVMPGDLIMIRDAGAYGTVRASNFGGMPLPAEVIISESGYVIVRKRQDFEGFMRGFCSWEKAEGAGALGQ